MYDGPLLPAMVSVTYTDIYGSIAKSLFSRAFVSFSQIVCVMVHQANPVPCRYGFRPKNTNRSNSAKIDLRC